MHWKCSSILIEMPFGKFSGCISILMERPCSLKDIYSVFRHLSWLLTWWHTAHSARLFILLLEKQFLVSRSIMMGLWLPPGWVLTSLGWLGLQESQIEASHKEVTGFHGTRWRTTSLYASHSFRDRVVLFHRPRHHCIDFETFNRSPFKKSPIQYQLFFLTFFSLCVFWNYK